MVAVQADPRGPRQANDGEIVQGEGKAEVPGQPPTQYQLVVQLAVMAIHSGAYVTAGI